MKKKYNKYLKGVNNTTRMIITEGVGYGVAGKVAGSVDTALGSTTASNVFSTGASLAGVPSLMGSASNVLGSLEMLSPKKKKR